MNNCLFTSFNYAADVLVIYVFDLVVFFCMAAMVKLQWRTFSASFKIGDFCSNGFKISKGQTKYRIAGYFRGGGVLIFVIFVINLESFHPRIFPPRDECTRSDCTVCYMLLKLVTMALLRYLQPIDNALDPQGPLS